jgi:hypothetical protein
MSRQMNQIVREMSGFPQRFDFDRDRLGEELAETTALAIWQYMEAETDPTNHPWIDLAARYEAWKAVHYPGRKMAELEMLMKDPDQLRGELVISARQLEQTYGTTERAKLEAEWFQEGFSGTDAKGRARYQPERRFYELNDLALTLLGIYLDDRFAATF